MRISSRLWLAFIAALVIVGISMGHAGSVNVAAGATGSGTASVQEFYAPGPLSCEMDNRPSIGLVGVFCQTIRSRDNRTARLKADGTVIGCRIRGGGDPGARCDLGNVGTGTPTFSVGQQATVGPFLCQVLPTGVQCTVTATGKGFLLTANSLTAVGGARIHAAPYHLSEFLSPDRAVWCGISAPPLLAFCAAARPSAANPAQHSAQLQRGGKVTLCSVARPSLAHVCVQNWDSSAPVLRAGQQSEVDGVLCTSARNGITCVLEAPSRHAGTGFRVNARSASRIVGCRPCARLSRTQPARKLDNRS
jgi:hypothetical protein